MTFLKGLAPWKTALLLVAFDIVLLVVFGLLRLLERVPWEAAFAVAGILSTGGRIPTAIRVLLTGHHQGSERKRGPDDDDEPPMEGPSQGAKGTEVLVTGGAATLLFGLLAWFPWAEAKRL